MASDLQKLKKKLDEIFSKYIRLAHSDNNGYCICYTCGKRGYWLGDGIQNGHYIPRNILVTRFDTRNCRPQCVGCNLFGNGKFIDFRKNLVAELGEEEVTELENSRFQTTKRDEEWYEKEIKKYKEEVKRLIKEKDEDSKQRST